MKKLIVAVAVLSVLGLGLEQASAKAKEKANKTKCSSKLDNLGSSGCDGIDQIADTFGPKIEDLLEADLEKPAWQLTLNAVRQARHRGHVTVLKLQETVDQCVAKMRRDGDSREDIAYIQKLGKKWCDQIKADTKAVVDSFFDIWTDVR